MTYLDMDENNLTCETVPEDDSFYKNDGWWAAFLLICIIFGPRTAPGSALPPVRLSDFVILFMLFSRWRKTYAFYRGFLFSPRIRLFSVFMFILAGTLTFSTILGTLGGRYPFFIKDYFIPLVFIRCAVIAAIMATFTLGPKQTVQFTKGLFFIALAAAALSFAQRFTPYLLSGIVERFYSIEYERLEIETEGTSSRVVGTFGNPNVWGACLVMAGSICIPAFVYMKGAIKLMALVVYMILGLAIFFTTGSRTSVIALMAVSMFAILFSFRGKAIIWIFLAALIIFPFFFWLRAHVDSLPINPRMQDFIRGEQTIEQGLSDRSRVWQRSLDAVKGSIIIGTGGSRSIYQLSDNGYIMMLLRTGIVGLSIYIVMLMGLLFRGGMAFLREKELHMRCLMLLSLMVLFCHILFEVVADFLFAVHYTEMLGVFMGLLCSSAKVSKDANLSLYYDSV